MVALLDDVHHELPDFLADDGVHQVDDKVAGQTVDVILIRQVLLDDGVVVGPEEEVVDREPLVARRSEELDVVGLHICTRIAMGNGGNLHSFFLRMRSRKKYIVTEFFGGR